VKIGPSGSIMSFLTNKPAFLAVVFLQIASLSLANTKLPPPPAEITYGYVKDVILNESNNIYFPETPNRFLVVTNLVVGPNTSGVLDFKNFRTDQYGHITILDMSIGENSVLIIKNINTRFLFSISDRDRSFIARSIVFDTGGGLVRSKVIPDIANAFELVPSTEPWTPIPEVSTYGTALSFSALGVLFIRKQKRESSRSRVLNPSLTPA